MSDNPLDLLADLDISSPTHQKVIKKEYAKIVMYENATSFSQLEQFVRCSRKLQLIKERAAFTADYRALPNIDFAYGHMVGAGVQHYLITKDLQMSLWQGMLAWDAGFTDEIVKKRKSIWNGLIAIEKFAARWEELFEDYELLILPNGKPAIELSFSFHCGNGFKHYAHLDIALRHKTTRTIVIVDAKTVGMEDPDESLYANSSQALSYSIMLQAALMEEIVEYDVKYVVYSTTAREWIIYTFNKSMTEQAEFIKDLLLQQDEIRTYAELDFYPKRGNACFDFFRRCEFYGECNITAGQRLPKLAEDEEAEVTDYVVDLNTVIAAIKEKRK